MTKKKVAVKAVLELNAYRIICNAVEVGVRRGYNRAHKHTETPGEEIICDEIENAVMGEIAEILKES